MVERVKVVADAVRAKDILHPVIAHVGCCSLIQDVLADTSDDRLMVGTVDSYGTSLGSEMCGDAEPEATPMNCDWTRSVNPNRYFWVNEAYSDPSAIFSSELGPEHVRKMFLTSVSHGAKGVMAWQYRAERVGIESGECGLVDTAGGDTPRSLEFARLTGFISKYEKIISASTVPTAEIAVVYDFRSDLLSAVEETSRGVQYKLKHPYSLTVVGAYKRALHGTYGMFWHGGYPVEWVDARDAGSWSSSGFKAIYLPAPFVTDKTYADGLLAYVRGGGTLITEVGFGMRGDNTWLELVSPGSGLSDVLGYKTDRHFRLENAATTVRLSELGKTPFAMESWTDRLVPLDKRARPFGAWAKDVSKHLAGHPCALYCAHGKGRVIILGFSPGMSFVTGQPRNRAGAIAFASKLASFVGVKPEPMASPRQKLSVRRLDLSGGEQMLFLRNYGTRTARFSLPDPGRFGPDLWGGSRKKGRQFELPSEEFAVLIERRTKK